MKLSLKFVFIVGLLRITPISGWLFTEVNNSDKESKLSSVVDDDAHVEPAAAPSRSRVSFEMKTMDERFLLEAKIAAELSPLDACHHRVVAELEGTCSELSEEQLAKLSVHLLNCQAAAEARTTFHCTSDMTIAECTQPMDAVTWNAYQIVSNRARAICYAARQQHFRLHTELMVNQLSQSSQQQLESLAALYKGHQKLKSVAENTIEKLELGQNRFAANQLKLNQAQQDIYSQVIGSLQKLGQEKELIVSGNQELIGKTKELRQKLEETADQLTKQSLQQSARHEHILEDLSHLGSQAQDISLKLDSSALVVETMQQNLVKHQRTALSNLHDINNTVSFLLSVVNGLRDVVDEKFDWLLLSIGANGDRLIILSSVFIHVLYLLISCCICVVLQLPLLTRLVVLVLVPLDAMSEIKYTQGLGLAGLTITVLAVTLANLLLCWSWLFWSKRHQTSTKMTESQYGEGLSASEIKQIIKALEKLSGDLTAASTALPSSLPGCSTPARPSSQFDAMDNMSQDKGDDHVAFSGLYLSPPPVMRCLVPTASSPFDALTTKLHRQWTIDQHTVNHSPVRSSASCSGTPVKQKPRARCSSLNRSFNRPLCVALTKTGQPCKLQSVEASNYCRRHQPQVQ